MRSVLTYAKELPAINETEGFLVKESAYATMGEDWLAFAQTAIDHALKRKKGFKTLSEAMEEGDTLLSLGDKAKNLLGMGKEFGVISLEIAPDKTIRPVVKITYNEMAQMFIAGESSKIHGMGRLAIIDRFLGYQWGQGKLLYPVRRYPKTFQRPTIWNDIVDDVPIVKDYSQWFEHRINTSEVSKKPFTARRQVMARILSSTTWKKQEDITEEGLTKLRTIVRLRGALGSDGRRLKLTSPSRAEILFINDIRYMLINLGRKDILEPREVTRGKRSSYLHSGKLIEGRYAWIDDDKYPNLVTLKQQAYQYLKEIYADGMSSGTINVKGSIIGKFFKYIIEMYSNATVDVAFVDSIFDPGNKKGIFPYLEELHGSKYRAGEILNQMILFFVYAELYSAKAKKNTPRTRPPAKRESYRDAMPREMVKHIVEILKERPPMSPTLWDRHKADASWWPHETYPVYPLLMLFMYYIPVRGGQARWLCRDNSFVFNSKGQIESFVINTDKNVNRKYLQEIPCVWDDLQVFTSFLAWHKSYFPNLKKIKYKNDDNAPWEPIVPLMIGVNTFRPIGSQIHMEYHKRVLCQYQIEVREEAKRNGNDDYPIVAWFRDGKPFFESVEELNRASTNKINGVKVAYDVHSLRVTGATRYLEAGVGLKTVMELTGHTNAETLLRVYIQLSRKEKEQTLRSAIDKIYFGDKETLIENGKTLIRGELAKAYERGSDSIETALNDNKLFSLLRKSYVNGISLRTYPGIEIAKEKHPSTWRPMIHGICPSVKCPPGKENRCSLCSHLITGKLFLTGIVHQLNNLFAAFQRESIIIEQEKSHGYDNHTKVEAQESLLEEILGWQEILHRITEDINNGDKDSSGAVVTDIGGKEVVKTESLPTELAYLKNAYDAKQIGAEYDPFGLKVLTIRAMKIAISMGDEDALNAIGQDEEKSIDLLMQYYTGQIGQNADNIGAFISEIKKLPKRTKEE